MHFGFGAANYEATDDLTLVKRQMIFSFIPAVTAMGASSYLVFAQPLAVPHLIGAFSTLMLT
jgi:hypothetical protein